jgi:valyl-tRNA synthetase
LQGLEQDVERHYTNYRFDLMSQALYEFIWNEYCDWYLELSKPVLWDENASVEVQRGTRRTLVRVLEALLRLAHPIMPFITEEIWLSIRDLAAREGDTIMLQPFPKADPAKIDAAAEADIEWVKGVIVGVRNIRGEMNIAPGKPLPVLFQKGSDEDKRRLSENENFLKTLAKLESVTWLEENDEAPVSATQLVGQLKVLVPMAGLIDVAAEQARLTKALEKTRKELAKVEGKLNNENFVSKAPDEVIAKEREKADGYAHSVRELEQQLEQLAALK